MVISNTSILIKRSSSSATPTLKAGELGYSYLSNTFFIGNSTGTGVVNVGGLLYTQTIDQATNANTGSTLVKRAADGSFSGQLFGNANTATALQTSRNFSVSGGDITASAVGFNGTGDVTLSSSLNSIDGLTGGVYGSTVSIPVIGVASNGRIMNVTTQTISTSFTVSGNTGSGTQNTGGTLTFQGGNTGITTTVTGTGGSETVTFNTDTTVLRSNTTAIGPQVIATDLSIAGNLTVTGTATYVNTSIVQTKDSLIELASNNTFGDVLDIGFYGVYNNGATNNVTGLIRDAGSKNYYLFSNVAVGDITSNTMSAADFTQANTATLYTNINAFTANITSLGVSSVANISSLGATTANIEGLTATDATINTAIIPTANITTLGVSGVSNLASLGATTANIDGLTVTNTTVTNTANIVTLGVSGVANLSSLGATTANIAGLTVTNTTVTSTANIATLGVSGVSNLASLGATTANIAGLTVTDTTVSGTANVATLGVSGVANLASLGATTANIAGLTVTNTTVTSTANISTLGVSGVANLSSLGATTANITGATISTLYLTNALGVPQGGTGASTFTANGIIFGNGTGALLSTAAAGSADQTWSNQILTVTNTGAPVWTTTMDGGTF